MTPAQPPTSCARGSTTPILTLTQQQPTPEPPANSPTSSSKSTTPLQELRRAVALKRTPATNVHNQIKKPHSPYFAIELELVLGRNSRHAIP